MDIIKVKNESYARYEELAPARPAQERSKNREDRREGQLQADHAIVYCTGPACILIDDMEKNIQEWTEFGGTGILFKDAGDARKQLEILGIL